jgi:alkylation response protein AidB-like acyl-CoA dehydrogenase
MPAFENDLSDPWVAHAADLRKIFHADAVPRDEAGGAPLEQVRLLREGGLLSAPFPVAYGGAGASWRSVLRAVRELAKTDGSLAQLLSAEHHVALHALVDARARAGAARPAAAWRRPGASGSGAHSGTDAVAADLAGARREGASMGARRRAARPPRARRLADRLLDRLGGHRAGPARLRAWLPADREGLVIDRRAGTASGSARAASGTVRLQGRARGRRRGARRSPMRSPRRRSLSLDHAAAAERAAQRVSLGSARRARCAEARDYTNTTLAPLGALGRGQAHRRPVGAAQVRRAGHPHAGPRPSWPKQAAGTARRGLRAGPRTWARKTVARQPSPSPRPTSMPARPALRPPARSSR